jgi:hypothetical protein
MRTCDEEFSIFPVNFVKRVTSMFRHDALLQPPYDAAGDLVLDERLDFHVVGEPRDLTPPAREGCN